MVRVKRSANCGNSPKNKMAEDIAVAVEIRDVEFLAAILDSGATWNYAGGTVTTAESILDHVGALNKPTSLTIDCITSHGKTGAVNGSTKLGKNVKRFCHVIAFTSARCNQVWRIESYEG